MEISKEWLEKKNACYSGVDWFTSQRETNDVELIKLLISEDKLVWANWLIARVMTYKEYISYAVFAAEQTEIQCPNDKRPRQAIEAAKKCITAPTKNNRAAARAAAEFANEAAEAAWGWSGAARAVWAWAAALAAEAAARAGTAGAVFAAEATAEAARAAWTKALDADEAAGALNAEAAARAARAESGAMKKILAHGLSILG